MDTISEEELLKGHSLDDRARFERAKEIAKRLRELGVKSADYGLATPRTRRRVSPSLPDGPHSFHIFRRHA